MVFLYFILFYRSSDDLSGSLGSPIQRLMQEFMPNAPKRPHPRRRRRNPDDSGYVPDLDEVPGIPVQLVFLSDSEDSGIIILSSDEYEESEDNNDNVIIISSDEMEEGNDNNNEDDDLNEAILNSPSPSKPKRLRLFKKKKKKNNNNKMQLIQFILKMCIFFSLNLLKLKMKKSIYDMNYGIYW